MKKKIQRALVSTMLLAGIGFWVGAAGSPAVAAEGPVTTPDAEPQACWECVRDVDCDAKCDGPGSGYCKWSGCTTCLCTR
ncbi:hypothetical protein [Chondromyces apiculatus]|uniref:Uncharacterized protein n=1 Tax=Chondromyces apiculatus DSM 436 TaxID=1192034 RepID=A0A017TEZ2_9BACT|nr:hypothetical protein [Chondromyces apiculatus]EYF07151.1 Hypothetical protein CAP_0630 [Chondromyces apiculatus DSM 436]